MIFNFVQDLRCANVFQFSKTNSSCDYREISLFSSLKTSLSVLYIPISKILISLEFEC